LLVGAGLNLLYCCTAATGPARFVPGNRCEPDGVLGVNPAGERRLEKQQMSKMLATCAAIAVTALIALPAPAGAVEKSAPGVKQQTELTDISAARRYHR